jgi:hypothetical protein
MHRAGGGDADVVDRGSRGRQLRDHWKFRRPRPGASVLPCNHEPAASNIGVAMANRAELTSRMARAKVANIGDLIVSIDACIVGTVRARRTLFSPGRGTACVAYQFRDSMGHDEQREVPFVVEDDSGGAMIDPSRALLMMTAHVGEGLHRSIVGAGYLRNHGRPGSFREQCVEVGQRIYVLGTCTREFDMKAAGKLYRDQPASRLRFAHRDGVPLLLTDRLAAQDQSLRLQRVS